MGQINEAEWEISRALEGCLLRCTDDTVISRLDKVRTNGQAAAARHACQI